jgi:hypothetical protein
LWIRIEGQEKEENDAKIFTFVSKFLNFKKKFLEDKINLAFIILLQEY